MRKSSSKDDARRMRKAMPLPPMPSMHQSAATSSNHHTNSLPRMHESQDEYILVMYKFSDDIPYRTKIPGKRLTLKHFKEYSPKKGNFR